MEPARFLNALKGLGTVCVTLNELVNTWNISGDGNPTRCHCPPSRLFAGPTNQPSRMLKKSHNSSLIASARSRPAQVFKIVRALTSPAPLVQNPATTALTAEAFQKFFTDKITVLRQELPPTVDTLSELETLWPLSGPILDRFTSLDKEDVTRILAVAKPTTCPLDPCPSWLVKSCLEGLLDPLSNIINGSLEQGVFPDNLKEARVRPLLKKPSFDPMTLANYRPVSNLPFLGKMIERAVLGQLQQFLDDTAGLDPFQSGFHPGHGTETVLVAITDELRRQSDSCGSALLVLLDLTVAFDTVDYDLMIHRLAMSGVRGQALNWFNSFLRNRSQCVEYMDQVSDRSPLLCGVPQGAILSPLLFNIYVRPLASLARSFGLDCYQYADDTQLLLCLEPGATSIPVMTHGPCSPVPSTIVADEEENMGFSPVQQEPESLHLQDVDVCPQEFSQTGLGQNSPPFPRKESYSRERGIREAQRRSLSIAARNQAD
uniref:Reverse transcriptase domain-containing protein n=1 Tax=Anolis carolinensis TaxID=28377 RepID=A0A803SWK3_ANOCA